jgi:hypothetical protein
LPIRISPFSMCVWCWLSKNDISHFKPAFP